MDWFEIALLILLGLLAVAVLLVGAVLGIFAFARGVSLRRDLSRLARSVAALEARLGAGARPAGLGEGEPPPVARAPLEPGGSISPPVLAPALAPEPTAEPGPRPAAEGPGAPDASVGGLESVLGKRGIAWAGAIVLFLSAGFFLKHAFDNEWIGPTGQVIVGALAGLILLVVGSGFLHKRWGVFGQCLLGLGVAILYATMFAAFAFYDPPVLGQAPAFALMVAVTVAAVALAVLYDALPIAFLALLGGLLTPVLLSTGEDARDALFCYLLLLDLGVLAAALFRGWRLLDALALTGTIALYAGWYHSFYEPKFLAPALGWLGGFYLVFLVLPFVYHLLRRLRLSIERFALVLVNATFAFVFAWSMLHERHSFALGFVAVALAAVYLAVGAVVRRRLPDDAATLFSAVALTVTFLTLAVPLQLHAHGITLAWAVEGPLILLLGYRFGYRPARVLAGVVLLIAAGRLFLSGDHWPLHAGPYVPLINSQFLSAILVPAAMAVFAGVHHAFRARGVAALDRAGKLVVALGGGFVALVLLHAEVHGQLARDHGSHLADCAAAVLYLAGAIVYLGAGVRWRGSAGWIWGAGAGALSVAFVLGARLLGDDLGAGHVLVANVRFASCLLVVVGLFAYGWTIRRTPVGKVGERETLAAIATGAGVLALLALLSIEVHDYCHDTIAEAARAGRAGQMAITLVWGLYAAGLIFVGFWRHRRPLRLGGLALFGASAVKLVVIDLTHVRDVYRIVSFFALGVLMVGVSYLYHRLEKHLAGPPAPSPVPDEPPPGERP